MALQNYEIIPDLRRDRGETAGGVGGGILVYVKNGLKVVPLETSSLFYQHCSFQVMTSNQKLKFILIYRPPSTGLDNTDLLYDLIESVGPTTYIIGDFNMPGIDWNGGTATGRGGRRLLQAAATAGLAQLVEGPTHIKGNLLDLILTNTADDVLSVKDEGRLGNSDHIMLSMVIDVDTGCDSTVEERYNWSKAGFHDIRTSLSSVDWTREMENLNVEECWRFFKTNIESVTEIFVPKSKQQKLDKPRWLTREIVRLLRQKKQAWKKYKRDMSMTNRNEYEAMSKKVKKSIQRAKTGMEKKLAHSNDDNGRKFRNYIKTRTRLKPKVGPLVTREGKMVTESIEMANELNNYFGSVFTRENVTQVPKKHVETNRTMQEVIITEEKIVEKIIKLRVDAAPGPDNITPRFLKETVDIVKIPLKIIFRKSLSQQKCPEDWKMAHVVPIYKKGTKGSASNYRPVSLTSVPCKILEQIIKDDLTRHLDENGLINDSQHGFTKGKSCTTNLVHFFDKVTESIDEGIPVEYSI